MQRAAVRVQRRADVVSRNFDVLDRAGEAGSVPALDFPEESDPRLWPVIFGGNEATQTANNDQQKPDF